VPKKRNKHPHLSFPFSSIFNLLYILLQDREKKLLMIVIPLQVLTNLASKTNGKLQGILRNWHFVGNFILLLLVSVFCKNCCVCVENYLASTYRLLWELLEHSEGFFYAFYFFFISGSSWWMMEFLMKMRMMKKDNKNFQNQCHNDTSTTINVFY
jgi:hypothetical protein